MSRRTDHWETLSRAVDHARKNGMEFLGYKTEDAERILEDLRELAAARQGLEDAKSVRPTDTGSGLYFPSQYLNHCRCALPAPVDQPMVSEYPNERDL